jgi:hypothetical protein
MSDFQSDPRVVAVRKRTYCGCCGRLIAPGDPAWTVSGSFDGDMYRVYEHPECHAAQVEFSEMFDLWGEEWTVLSDARNIVRNPNDFWRWIYRKHPLAAHYLDPARYIQTNDAETGATP